MKRPQSAITRVDDANSTASKPIRPLSGVSDTTLRFQNSVDQLLSKANYSLQLMNIHDSLQLFEQAFKKGEHQLSSIRLVKLVEDVVLQLVKVIVKSEDNLISQQILNRLLIWCQIQQSNEDIIHIRCPPYIQVRVLNAYGDFLRKQNKYDESTHYLQLSLQMLSQYKFDSSIDELVGQTYMLLSSNSLYTNHYAQAIQEAQAALQHLQQAAISTNKITEELHESICDTYINLGIAKEQEKQFQEAHYNYYSSLVYSQQNLNESKQMKIQQIYDQFLSRQAAYLQKLQFQQQKSLKQINSVTGFNQKKPQQSALLQQPFVDLVKNANDQSNGKLNSNFFKKKQKIIKSVERQKQNEERAILKFKPYLNKMPGQSSQVLKFKPNQMLLNSQIPRPQSPLKQPFVNNGIKIMKVSNKPDYKVQNKSLPSYKSDMFLAKKLQGQQQQQQPQQFSSSTSQLNSAKIYSSKQTYGQSQQTFQSEVLYKNKTNQFLSQQSTNMHQIPSKFIQYLEQNINESNLLKNGNVQLLQSYQNIHLPSIESQSGIQEIYQGTMSIYLFSQQNILYFQYLASEIADQFAVNLGPKKIKLIGNSLNVSDVNNQFNTINQNPLGMKNVLLSFSVEYFRYAKINLDKQCFQLPYNQANQFYIYIPEQNQNLLIQVKNEYESLVFLVDSFEENGQTSKDQEIQPIFNHKSNSVVSDEIHPLLAEQIKQIDEDVQPVFEEQEEKLATSQEYSQDFEPTPIMEEAPQDKFIQKSSSLPQNNNGKNQYDGMEKFTIKIESEDQRQQVIEVYATDKKQQQDEEIKEEEDHELNAAALLIQKKFREKRMNLKH
ncbi:unnamed protein product [Paramecium octaurelia]|uniref:Tetratricopeptide repeat protein n=1 Tax=Paramecium octaurelia TaxID=43137 RepID=A0A8S1T0I4_PAROT|nr:unnamed protein product [Paramecium octaurelia]